LKAAGSPLAAESTRTFAAPFCHRNQHFLLKKRTIRAFAPFSPFTASKQETWNEDNQEQLIDMATKQAFLRQLQDVAFAAKADSNHWVVMDGPESVGGTNAGSRPKDLLLFALAGCTASDVVSILKKKRAPLQGFEMNVTGHEAEEHPKVFTDIQVVLFRPC
jgi:organic hydroperoxide reductase OsmC/OhrA